MIIMSNDMIIDHLKSVWILCGVFAKTYLPLFVYMNIWI